MKYLIFLPAATLFFPLICGCGHVQHRPTAEIAAPSESNLYVCGFLTEKQKAEESLQCAPLEKFLVEYNRNDSQEQKL